MMRGLGNIGWVGMMRRLRHVGWVGMMRWLRHVGWLGVMRWFDDRWFGVVGWFSMGRVFWWVWTIRTSKRSEQSAQVE